MWKPIYDLHTFVQSFVMIQLFFVISLLNADNRFFLHWDTAMSVTAELNDNNIFRDVDNNTIETACCQNTVTNCKICDHCIHCLLTFLLYVLRRNVRNPWMP